MNCDAGTDGAEANECPLDLLKTRARVETERRLEEVWLHLVPVYNATHVVRRILDFPQLLIDAHRAEFLDLVARVFLDMVILRVSNALSPREEMSFPRIKCYMVSNAKAKQGKALDEALGEVLDDETSRRVDSALTLRDRVVAHLDRKFLRDKELRKSVSMSFEDVEGLVKSTKTLLVRFEGGPRRAMVTEEYAELDEFSPSFSKAQGLERQATIDFLLRCVAEHSTILNMPEQQADYWAFHSAGLSDEELTVLNEWRAKVGKSPVMRS